MVDTPRPRDCAGASFGGPLGISARAPGPAYAPLRRQGDYGSSYEMPSRTQRWSDALPPIEFMAAPQSPALTPRPPEQIPTPPATPSRPAAFGCTQMPRKLLFGVAFTAGTALFTAAACLLGITLGYTFGERIMGKHCKCP